MSLWIGLYVVFFEVIFLHTGNIAGWGRGEVLTFLAFYYFITGLGNVFYRESFEQFSEKMRRGLIDQKLTKPVSFQIITFFEHIRFDHFIDVFVTGLLFIYISVETDVVFSLPYLFTALIISLLGNTLFYGTLLFVTSFTFIVDRFDAASSFIWHISQVSRYPRQIYTGVGKYIFQFFFPIALIASIPAEFALQSANLNLLGYFLGISILFLIIGNLFFRWGLSRYSSAN